MKGYTLEEAKICVGKGWHSILEDLYSKLGPDTVVNTVKEKFGGLRVYIDTGSIEMYDNIDAAEAKSLSTCEDCGSLKGARRSAGRSGYWIRTLCPDCNIKEADKHDRQANF